MGLFYVIEHGVYNLNDCSVYKWYGTIQITPESGLCGYKYVFMIETEREESLGSLIK